MQIHSVSSTISKTGLNNVWWTCLIFVWITFHYRTLEPQLVTTSAYIFLDMFLWDKFIIEIELHLFSCGCNSWLLHVSFDTLARASAFRVFLMDCLFVCLYGMCCEFSAISFLKEHHSISDMFWVQFLLLVAWCFLFPDVLLLILLPCTVLVFYSFTLYLYICNNNYLTTELLFFLFYVSLQ